MIESLAEYIRRDRIGNLWANVTYRAYDLSYKAGPNRLRDALAYLGIRNSEISVSVSECEARLRALGVEVPRETLERCLQEWFLWQRLVSGRIRKWKRRETTGTKPQSSH